ncbi:MAG: bifunctional UDP-N-acetylglucosamine diphosphorylase/glucosamine-1-phosphate N-acetyltransferase GlmU [Clostridia bacterium]|nr:bifunctional UDP-N-acetylglucosamine diphosphorylase/glucosamine-1-phosphate N-acetyltransferase GlmU [Clostridia bacterium]
MENTCAVILAAGNGKRMKSEKPKALCEVLFRPMIDWVLDAIFDAGIKDVCVVTGSQAEMLEEHLGDSVKTVRQLERLGTANAAKAAEAFIKEHIGDDVLILNGDAPFIDSRTIVHSHELHSVGHAQTVISAIVDNPFGYGRIVRSEGNVFEAIVEEASADERIKAIREINSGCMWFRAPDLLFALDRIKNDNSKGEYYLTDSVDVLKKAKKMVAAYTSSNPDSVLGANSRRQLAQLTETARQRIFDALYDVGVDIPCTDGVMISKDAKIGADTQILPGTIIKHGVTIGKGCVVGPNTILEETSVGDGTTLNNVCAEYARVGSDCRIGPFAHIRPQSVIADGVKMGNFTEVKNSTVGENTSVAHLTYVGDSDVGSDVNFGCGTVTVNFDGKNKYRTTIGDGAFIGCNTNLIAPVKIGRNAYTAAGSTITEDVPDNAMSIARSRQTNKDEWVVKKQPYRREV